MSVSYVERAEMRRSEEAEFLLPYWSVTIYLCVVSDRSDDAFKINDIVFSFTISVECDYFLVLLTKKQQQKKWLQSDTTLGM